jgi:hypothetical protein
VWFEKFVNAINYTYSPFITAFRPLISAAFASDSAKEKPVCPVVKKRLLNGQVLVGYVRGSRAVGGRCLPPSAQDLHAAIEGPRGKAEKAAMPTCPVVKKTLAGTGEQHHGFAVDLTRGECRPPGKTACLPTRS